MKEDIKDLENLCLENLKNSYSPYSKIKVTSALKTSSGKIFTWCNIENSSFSETICAERVAIFKALSEGEKEISLIYVYSEKSFPPCGPCRQVLSEFASKDLKVVVGGKEGHQIYDFEDIYPNSFSKESFKWYKALHNWTFLEWILEAYLWLQKN